MHGLKLILVFHSHTLNLTLLNRTQAPKIQTSSCIKAHRLVQWTPRALFVGSTVSFMKRKTPTSYLELVKKDDNSRYADYQSNQGRARCNYFQDYLLPE